MWMCRDWEVSFDRGLVLLDMEMEKALCGKQVLDKWRMEGQGVQQKQKLQ